MKNQQPGGGSVSVPLAFIGLKVRAINMINPIMREEKEREDHFVRQDGQKVGGLGARAGILELPLPPL